MDIYIYMKDNSGIISIVASNIRIYMYIFVARNIKKGKYTYTCGTYIRSTISILCHYLSPETYALVTERTLSPDLTYAYKWSVYTYKDRG